MAEKKLDQKLEDLIANYEKSNDQKNNNQMLDNKMYAPIQRRVTEFSDSNYEALHNERLFKRRFGLITGFREREALFNLIERYDFSDQDIKTINRIGSFGWNGTNFKIGVSGWVLLQGFSQLGVIVFHTLIFGLLFIWFPAPSIEKSGLLFVMIVLLLLFGAFVSNLYLKPYQIIQKRIQVLCKGKSFSHRLLQRFNCHLTL